MKKPHIFNFSVAYADTDAEGVMYHARYIEVAERARSNWSKDIVLPDGRRDKAHRSGKCFAG